MQIGIECSFLNELSTDGTQQSVDQRVTDSTILKCFQEWSGPHKKDIDRLLHELRLAFTRMFLRQMQSHLVRYLVRFFTSAQFAIHETLQK